MSGNTNSLEDLVRASADVMAANTQLVTESAKLSQLLVEARASYEDKQERINTDQVDRLIRANGRLQFVICALIAIGSVGAYLLVHRMDAVEASSQTAMKEALEANTRARAEEGTRTKFQEQQIRFNATVTEALEELSK